jgi:hypothetical protein
VVTGRAMRLVQEIGRWYAVANDPSLGWSEKPAAYSRLVDDGCCGSLATSPPKPPTSSGSP